MANIFLEHKSVYCLQYYLHCISGKKRIIYYVLHEYKHPINSIEYVEIFMYKKNIRSNNLK